MDKSLALSVVIGGAIGASFRRMLGDVKSDMDGLQRKGDNTRAWMGVIKETQGLQRQMGQLKAQGGQAYDELKRKLDANTAKLKDAKIAVGELGGEYARLGKIAKGIDLQARGRQRLDMGKADVREGATQVVAMGALAAAPVRRSAGYQAELRDIGIKAGFDYQKDGAERERAMGLDISDKARANGMGEQDLARAVNVLVAGGMKLQEAMHYAGLVAKTSVGQKAEASDVTAMMGALSTNLGITTEKAMTRAMEILAHQGKAGKFEFNAMARYLPEMSSQFAKRGLQGEEAVRAMGAALQVMRMGAGTDEEAAGNLKNWMEKINAGETTKNYKDVGIDYEGSMLNLARDGMNPFEASLELARQYIEKTDAATAARLKASAAQAATITDGARRDAFVTKLQESFKTGDLFADMQVKSALAAYLQNTGQYRDIRDTKDAKTGEDASRGTLERDLEARRAASLQKWSEAGQKFDTALRKIGDSLVPLTDPLADGLAWVADGLGAMATALPKVTMGLAAAAGAFAAYKLGKGALNIGMGGLDLLRGKRLGRKAGKLPGLVGAAAEAALGDVQKVFVVNMPGSGMGAGLDLPDGPGKGRWARLKGLASRLGGWAGAAMGAGRTALTVGGTSVLGAGSGTGSVGALAGAGTGTLAASTAMVGAAGLAGYGAGSLLYHQAMAGTAWGDKAGYAVARLRALLGDQEAKDALAREARYDAAQAGQPLPDAPEAPSAGPAGPTPARVTLPVRKDAAPMGSPPPQPANGPVPATPARVTLPVLKDAAATPAPSAQDGGIRIDFSPVFHLAAGTPEAMKAAAKQVAQDSLQEFERLFDRLMAQRERRRFA